MEAPSDTGAGLHQTQKDKVKWPDGAIHVSDVRQYCGVLLLYVRVQRPADSGAPQTASCSVCLPGLLTEPVSA